MLRVPDERFGVTILFLLKLQRKGTRAAGAAVGGMTEGMLTTAFDDEGPNPPRRFEGDLVFAPTIACADVPRSVAIAPQDGVPS